MTKLFVTPVATTDDKPKNGLDEDVEKKGNEMVYSVQPHILPVPIPHTTIVNKPMKCRMSWLVCLIILLWLTASLIIVFHLTPECLVRRLRALTAVDNRSPTADRFVFDVAEPHIKAAPKLEQHARQPDIPTPHLPDQMHVGDFQRILLLSPENNRPKPQQRLLVNGDFRDDSSENEVKVIEVKNLNALDEAEKERSTPEDEQPNGETPVYHVVFEQHLNPIQRPPQFFMHPMHQMVDPMMYQFMMSNPYAHWNYMNRHRQAMKEWMMQVEQYNRQLQLHKAQQTMRNELPRFMQPPPAPVQQPQWPANPDEIQPRPPTQQATPNVDQTSKPEGEAVMNQFSVPQPHDVPVQVNVQHDAAPVRQTVNEPEEALSPEQHATMMDQIMHPQEQVASAVAQVPEIPSSQQVQPQQEPDRDEIFRRLLAISQQMQNAQHGNNDLLFWRTQQDLQAAQVPERDNVQQQTPQPPEKSSDEIYRDLLQRSNELQRTQHIQDIQKAPEQNTLYPPQAAPSKSTDEIYRELLEHSQDLQRTQQIQDAQKAQEQSRAQLQEASQEKTADEIYHDLLQRSQELERTRKIQDSSELNAFQTNAASTAEPLIADDDLTHQSIVDDPEAAPEVIEVPPSATEAPVQPFTNATERTTADPLNAFFRFFEQETIKANKEQPAAPQKEDSPESGEVASIDEGAPRTASDAQPVSDLEPVPDQEAVTDQPDITAPEATATSEQPVVVQEKEGEGEIQLDMNKNWSKDQVPLVEVGERPIVRIE